MSESIKVLVIEDHPIVRDGCQRIFNRRSDIEMSEASSGAAGLDLNKTLSPDVIILDVGLPDTSGFDIIPSLLSENAKARILVLSMYGTSSFVTSALEKGAAGYITKNDDPNTILTAIDKMLAGETYLGQALAQSLAISNLLPANDPLHALNGRERDIVTLLGNGRSLTEISVDLGLGYKTVANAVSLIKQKLRITTNSALIKFAVELKLSA